MIKREYKAEIMFTFRNQKGEISEQKKENKTYKIKSFFRLSKDQVKDFIFEHNIQSKFDSDNPTIEVLEVFS